MTNRTTLSTEANCADFVEGCLYLGTGGGGNPDVGMETLRAALADGLDIGWVDIDDIDDDALTVTAYSSGSIAPPDPATAALIESLGLSDPQSLDDALVEAIDELGRHLGRSVSAVVPVEIGAANSPGPIVAAARLGLVVPDGDYTGRAAPDEMQGTPFIHDIDSHPLTSVDSWGNVAVIPRVVNGYMLERITKMLSLAGVDGTSIASTPLDGREMKRIIVPGTLSLVLRIGRAARQARSTGEDPVAATIEAADAWRLFDGKVIDKTWEDRDGYMFGTLELEGTLPGSMKSSNLKIWLKNENHVTWLDGEPWVCSPDLISIIDTATATGHTSTNIAPGDVVTVVGMRGLDCFRTPHALANAAGPGYYGFPEVRYRPIEELV